jgi:hypothetical protein
MSGIECDDSDLCIVKENEESINNYFDNIYLIFKNISVLQIFILFLISVCLGALKLLINLIINYYTTCHIFIFLQNHGISDNIKQEMDNSSNLFIKITVGISNLLSLIFSAVFLEIIEFKCFGLNENFKENIKKRVDEENNRISAGENDNVDENEEQDNSFSNEDSQD